MAWLIVGLMIGVPIGMFILALVSIRRMRDTQEVADTAVDYATDPNPQRLRNLRAAVNRLRAE